MPQRNVATNFTFEQQRLEINLLAQDFWTQKGTVDTAASTYLKHDGTNAFTGATLAVPNAFTINSNSGNGTVTIAGNLQVDGTTTTVNTATMDVVDKNITIAKGSANDAAADGAGITIDSATDITFNFVDAKDALVSSIGLEATTFLKGPYGQFTGSATPTTGSGVEVNAPDANTGQIIAYNRGTSAYNELRLKGASVPIYTGTTNAIVGTFNSTGLTMESGKTLGIGVAPASSQGSELAVKGSDGATNVSLIPGADTEFSQIGFYNAAYDSQQGYIKYDNNNNSLSVRVNLVERLRIGSDGTVSKYHNATDIAAAFGGGGQVNGVTALPSMVGTPFVVAKDTGSGKSAAFAGSVTIGANGSITSGGNFTLSGNGLTVTGSTTAVGEFIGATQPTVQITQTTDNTDLQLRANATGGLVRTATNKPLVLGANQAEALHITGTGQVNIGGDYTQTTYKTQIETTNGNVLRLVTDSDDANGVELVLRKDSASPADNDNIGNIYFQGNDDGGNATFYASMEAYSDDVSNGSENGYIRFRTRDDGTMGERLRIHSDGQVTIGNDHSGAATWDGDLVVANTNGGRISVGDTGSGERFDIAANGDINLYSYLNGDHINFHTTDGSGTIKRFNITTDGTLNKYHNATDVSASFPGSGQVNGVTGLPSAVGTPFVVAKDTGSGKSAAFAGTVNVGRLDCDGLMHIQYGNATNTNYMSSFSNSNGIMHLFRGDGLYIGDNMNTSNQAGGPNNKAITLGTNGAVTAAGTVTAGSLVINGSAVQTHNSTDTNHTDNSLPSASSGFYVRNGDGTTGTFTSIGLIASSTGASSDQSASLIAKCTASGLSPEVYLTQRDGNNSQRNTLAINTLGDATFIGTVSDHKGNLRTLPRNEPGSNAAYTAQTSDKGKFLSVNSNVTFDNSATWNTGDVVTVYNYGSSALTIVSGTGVLIHYTDGTTASTGNRSLAARGLCTLLCVEGSNNTFVISGALT